MDIALRVQFVDGCPLVTLVDPDVTAVRLLLDNFVFGAALGETKLIEVLRGSERVLGVYYGRLSA